MLSQSMLRNIHKVKLRNYLRQKEISNLNQRAHSQIVSDYAGILEVLKEEITTGTKLNADIVDDFIYNQIFYEKCNYYYVYKLDNINIDLTLSEPAMIQYLIDKGFNVNHLLTQGDVASNYDLCTT
ncbi:hypothetical protein LCG60_00070 [Bacillus sp. SD-4]|nr:hypothetical protein LCG60_00070 [Bacillus sp. SD-4]